MPNRPWKSAERKAAKLLGGRRFWANSGEKVDCESDSYVAQVKEVGRCSLQELESLALEVQRQGIQRNKIGLLIIKRRGGRGRETPTLIVTTTHGFREMNGARALDFVSEPNAVNDVK
jgi:hypothetical protein